MSALEQEDWFAGALIRDANGDIPLKPCSKRCEKCSGKGCPSWRYRVEPFQRAFLASGMTIADVEARAGWAGGYLSRAIGLRMHPSGKRARDGVRRLPVLKRTMSYEMAVRVARALDLDFTMWEL